VASASILAEVAAWASSRKMTIYDLLLEMYEKFSLYRESLTNLVRKGKSGAEEIQLMMADFRTTPPETLSGSPVSVIHDYLQQETTEISTGTKTPIDLPKSNVLQFLTEEGSKISVRPSGTEPKIKFYISVNDQLESSKDFRKTWDALGERIENLKKDLKLG
jgi:phosphoglucomutase